jgi:hypothetical protein
MGSLYLPEAAAASVKSLTEHHPVKVAAVSLILSSIKGLNVLQTIMLAA